MVEIAKSADGIGESVLSVKRLNWTSAKIIIGFALLGLAVAGVCYAYAALHDYSKPMNGLEATLVLLSVVLCPPQLLFAFCIDCEVVGWDGVIQYSIVAFLNVALYALIGVIVANLRKDRSAGAAGSSITGWPNNRTHR